MNWIRFLVVYFLVLAAALFIHQKHDYIIPEVQPLSSIPMQYGGWKMIKQAYFDKRVLAVLLPSEYISRTYEDGDGNKVDLYLGYHNGAPGTGGIHSPKNCLPGSGWYRVSEEIQTLYLEKKEISMVSAVYQKDASNELFLYWFQVRGKTLTNEYALKLAEITGSMFHNRRDTAFIRISVPFNDDLDNALVAGKSFIRDFYLEFDRVLPE